MIRRTLLFVFVLCLTACGVKPELAIALGAKGSTVGALYALKATPETVAKVQQVATSVELSTIGGIVDYAAVRDGVLTQIRALFTDQQQQILLTLIGDLSSLVLAALPPNPPQNQILMYANSAAVGVKQGCELYTEITAPRNPAVALQRHLAVVPAK